MLVYWLEHHLLLRYFDVQIFKFLFLVAELDLRRSFLIDTVSCGQVTTVETTSSKSRFSHSTLRFSIVHGSTKSGLNISIEHVTNMAIWHDGRLGIILSNWNLNISECTLTLSLLKALLAVKITFDYDSPFTLSTQMVICACNCFGIKSILRKCIRLSLIMLIIGRYGSLVKSFIDITTTRSSSLSYISLGLWFPRSWWKTLGLESTVSLSISTPVGIGF